jgi:hypothetical protein
MRIDGRPDRSRAKANAEIWLENRNGIVMRLDAAQAGLTFGQGRYEPAIQLSQ